MSKNYFYSCK